MTQSKINVAIVDDDESFARSLERLFRAAGFESQIYPTAETFLAAIPFPHPDCLVLDIHLGGMSGLDLQRRLGELGNLSPIIFVTAHEAPQVRDEAEQGGCSAFFRKPVPGKMLIEAVKQTVQQFKDKTVIHANSNNSGRI